MQSDSWELAAHSCSGDLNTVLIPTLKTVYSDVEIYLACVCF